VESKWEFALLSAPVAPDAYRQDFVSRYAGMLAGASQATLLIPNASNRTIGSCVPSDTARWCSSTVTVMGMHIETTHDEAKINFECPRCYCRMRHATDE